MATVRARLTTANAVALAATLIAFSLVLLVARRASAYRELAARVEDQASAALRVVTSAEEEGAPVTVRTDSSAAPVVAPQLHKKLEGIGDYVLILDASGRALYASFLARQLSLDELARLQQAALQARPDGPARFVQLDSSRLLLVARPDTVQQSQVTRVVTAVDTRSADEAPGALAVSMVGLVPLFVLLGAFGAWFISALAFRPVELIINEVEAITDGRSLHRRLPTEAGDELGRLSATLNAMIARLETSFGALRRFTADASHELKTPLTVLRADVERAMNPRSTHTEQLVALEEALQEVARMADLVDSLLTLARADEGRFELATEPIHLEPLVREVFETAVILGEDVGLAVSLPVIEDAVVMGDRTRLRQLFLNLVTNAIKYTPRGGKVEVSLGRRLDEATFTVRDTGIGIAAADLPHVFERFWRADRARSRRAGDAAERGSFGLGLSISQYIAQAHRGSLTVQSRLGRGTVFTVALPLAPDPAPEGEDEAVQLS
ncbi:MAG: HAMP domain-containing protein [Gemmatimonadaceae bacterium]|nr:HAMP domain-containing protein [Gemmatimonadaceae bacterium]